MFFVRSMGIPAHALCVWHGHPCPCSLCVAWASLPMFFVCGMDIPTHVLCVAWASLPMFFVRGMGIPAHVLCVA
jgi:hypothetical protein